MKKLLISGALALGMSTTAYAATIGSADVVFIVDESGSMAGEQAFLEDVIPDLDTALSAEGITATYGVIGFGASNPNPRIVRNLGDAATTASGLDAALQTSGGFEDGYAGMKYALDNLSLTADAINFVLVTDEDRDVLGAYNSINYASMLGLLTGSKVVLNAVVNNALRTGTNAAALGVNDKGESYVADGSGGFVKAAGGVVTTTDFGTTKEDYSDLALATKGAVWDLNILRQGGLFSDSFAAAFIDIKVEEIKDQIDPGGKIPLPAGAWLMLGGLGALGAMKRRKQAA